MFNEYEKELCYKGRKYLVLKWKNGISILDDLNGEVEKGTKEFKEIEAIYNSIVLLEKLSNEKIPNPQKC